MTQKELIASALQHMKNAEAAGNGITIGYPLWQERIAAGYYKDVKNTKWWVLFDEIAKAEADLKTASEMFPRVAAADGIFLFGDNK